MIITSLSKSRYAQWDHCEQQYFITNVLGYTEDKPNKKTEKGSAVHLALECLAELAKKYQEGSLLLSIDNEKLGEIGISKNKFFVETILLPDDIDKINKKSESGYNIAYGHRRFGELFINTLCKKAYKYYATQSEHTWDKQDLIDIKAWTWAILDYNNGMFDPRYLHILDHEKRFSINIDEDWAHYEFQVGDKSLVGNLKLTGFVDLVIQVDSDTIEIIDWKTGARKNWTTNKVKTLDYLQKDFEMLFYAYCGKKLYPQAKNIILTMFFVNDGGPFTFSFTKESEELALKLIKERFAEIKNRKLPKLLHPTQGDYKCRNWCPFYKDGNFCRKIKQVTDKVGLDDVITQFSKKVY